MNWVLDLIHSWSKVIQPLWPWLICKAMVQEQMSSKITSASIIYNCNTMMEIIHLLIYLTIMSRKKKSIMSLALSW